MRQPGAHRHYAWTVALTASLLLAAARAGPLELDTVLANATVKPPDRVAFREERHNPMLAEPLILTGHLEYLRAGVLRKVVETPFEEAFLIDSDVVVIERGGRTRKLALNRSRSLRAILGAIEALLSGNADKVALAFDCELSGSADAWAARLTPLSRRIGRQLTSLHVNGDDQSVTSIRIDLQNGEWHQMDILRDDET